MGPGKSSETEKQSSNQVAREDPKYQPKGHNGPKLLELEIPLRENFILSKHRHNGGQLSLILVKNAQHSIFGKHAAYFNISKLTKQQHDLLSHQSPDKYIGHCLSEYYDILDEAFFVGSLASIIKLKLYRDEKDTQFGFYDEDTSSVYLNLHLQVSGKPYIDTMKQRIATMVHEMVHAFLDTFSCNCKACETEADTPQGVGPGGHGTLWCDAMKEIQGSMNRDLDWTIDCGILNSLGEEMETCKWIPTSAELKRWGVRLFPAELEATRDREDNIQEETLPEDGQTGFRQFAVGSLLFGLAVVSLKRFI